MAAPKPEVSLPEQMALLKSSLEKTYRAEMEVALGKISDLEHKISASPYFQTAAPNVRDSQNSGSSTGMLGVTQGKNVDVSRLSVHQDGANLLQDISLKLRELEVKLTTKLSDYLSEWVAWYKGSLPPDVFDEMVERCNIIHAGQVGFVV